MAQRAGIALGRLADDAEFSITQVDGAPGPASFSSPIHDKLTEGSTIKGIIDHFNRSVNFDAKLVNNGFAISFPILTSFEQRKAFREANRQQPVHDHFHAWAVWHAKYAPNQKDVTLLFIDLTPGQVASAIDQGSIQNGKWACDFRGIQQDKMGRIRRLTTQDVIEKLVTPLARRWGKLYRVGILRPKGAFPKISATGLEARFSDTVVDWLTLDDLSHGAAIVMHHEWIITSPSLYKTPRTIDLRVGIALASGELVTVLSEDDLLPTIRKIFFTSSQDNQSTATVQLAQGITPRGEISLEGLAPRMKGDVRIKVTLDIKQYGNGKVIVEEIGTRLKNEKDLGNITTWNFQDLVAYRNTTKKQVDMVLGQDGVIGELPE
jgi:hypothetical protein